MAQPDKTALPDISHIRKEIDRVDNALLGLIAERLALAAEVRRSKSGVGVWRPSREESHVRDLAERAGDTPAALVSRIMAELMSASLTIQGPMTLHLALEGDALTTWSMVRDRFGASIPAFSYPTTSAALTAVISRAEAVAVLPAPGGMNSWWSALCAGGAMAHLHILAALPRVEAGDWPKAVAVADCAMDSSGADRTLIGLPREQAGALKSAIPSARLRAETGDLQLFSVDHFIAVDEFAAMAIEGAKIIGVLPKALDAKEILS